MNTKIVERSVFHHTNRARKRHSLNPLTSHRSLIGSSREHSAWMGTTASFSHAGKYGTAPYQRAKSHGFPTESVGENISQHWVKGRGRKQDWKLGREAVDGWMNSPGHRANILSFEYNCIGIGVAVHNDKVYLTQNFGNSGFAAVRGVAFQTGLAIFGALAVAAIAGAVKILFF